MLLDSVSDAFSTFLVVSVVELAWLVVESEDTEEISSCFLSSLLLTVVISSEFNTEPCVAVFGVISVADTAAFDPKNINVAIAILAAPNLNFRIEKRCLVCEISYVFLLTLNKITLPFLII